MQKRHKEVGFSMIEVLIAVGVILVVTAIAVPSVMRSVRAYRLGGVAADVSNILQRTRYEAIRRNTVINCRALQAGETWTLFIDLNNDNAMNPAEPMIQLPADVQFLAGGVAPSPATMGAAYANAQVPPLPWNIAFDSRGAVDFGAGAPSVFVVYLGYTGGRTGFGFRAVTLTPVGRTKVWSAAEGGGWHSP